MTELRQNMITREWVIIASERAKRPHEFAQKKSLSVEVPCYKADCPFCVGNENLTGIESYRISDPYGWKVRALINKYPALSNVGERIRKVDGLYHSLSGVGFHEVIIEHPRHDLTIATMEIPDIANVLRVYKQRYQAIRNDPRIESIIIFKNHGISAGTSLEHPHSQLAATPIVPYQLRLRTQEAIRFFDDTGSCIFCKTLETELLAKQRIILETEHFVSFIPYAAFSPFHTWIFPRRHDSSFDKITEDEIVDLAKNLKIVLAKLYYGLNNPDYNYTIRSIPTADERSGYFHWYLAIVPRTNVAAGFEMGSGMFINTALPEESAEFLRNVKLPFEI
jgi:UDPglucose--hexose-1-phosphate uridylyltransferase